MKLKLLLFILLFSTFALGQTIETSQDIDCQPVNRIIDGGSICKEDIKPPIDVLGDSNGSIYCNYEPINEFWGLTVAHCVFGKRPDTLQVGSGQLTYEQRTNRNGIAVKRVFVHPAYNPNTLENDLALIELQDPVPFQTFPKIIDVDKYGDRGVAKMCGWGNTSRPDFDSKYPDTLQCGMAIILPDAVCEQRVGLIFYPATICTDEMLLNGFSGADTGDSGGLITIFTPDEGYTLAALISRGIAGEYGGNTEVIHYKDWIDGILVANGAAPTELYNPSGTTIINEPISDDSNGVINMPEFNLLEFINNFSDIILAGIFFLAFIFFFFRKLIVQKLPFMRAFSESFDEAKNLKANAERWKLENDVANKIVEAGETVQKLTAKQGTKQSGLDTRAIAIEDIKLELASQGIEVTDRKATILCDSAYDRRKLKEDGIEDRDINFSTTIG